MNTTTPAGRVNATAPARHVNAVRAEAGKLLTLPSLWITAGLTVAVTLLLRIVDTPGSAPRHTLPGLLVFGVLAAAHEFQGGNQIRATLLAVPRRLSLAAAKAAALLLVAAPLAATVAILGGDPGAALPLTVSMLTAAGVGGVLRQAAVAAGTVLTSYVMIGPLIRTRWPGSEGWLPDTVVLDAGHGLPAALTWAVAMLALSALALRRRDA